MTAARTLRLNENAARKLRIGIDVGGPQWLCHWGARSEAQRLLEHMGARSEAQRLLEHMGVPNVDE